MEGTRKATAKTEKMPQHTPHDLRKVMTEGDEELKRVKRLHDR